MTPARINGRTNAFLPRNSGLEPVIEPALEQTRATVFVTLALTGGRPAASSAGYDTSDASPAILPDKPPPIPATTSSTASTADTAAVWRGRRRLGRTSDPRV